MISFTEKQLQDFENGRTTELAEWCANAFSERYQWRMEQLKIEKEKKVQLVPFFKTALEQSEIYLQGTEQDRDYNKWRILYAELAFLIGWDFDTHPWTNSILNETIWHPFLRLDILGGIYEICFNNPQNKQFFQQLSEISG